MPTSARFPGSKQINNFGGCCTFYVDSQKQIMRSVAFLSVIALIGIVVTGTAAVGSGLGSGSGSGLGSGDGKCNYLLSV